MISAEQRALWLTAMKERHSVRTYLNRPLEEDKICSLREETDRVNRESGLNVQLITEEERAFGGAMAHYGSFSGVRNYFALIGPDRPGAEETVGYYGEQLVLAAQALGLNTCWVALTYSKRACRDRCAFREGDKLFAVISVGYGATQGKPHRDKPAEKLCRVSGEMPDWFRAGLEAAILAPTALNQQKFRFDWDGETLQAVRKVGPYSEMDFGIVKLHFELGSGRRC